MKQRLVGCIIVLCLAVPLIVRAGAPMEAVKTEVDAVIEILRNPALKGEAGLKVKRERTAAAATKLFDFVELSKRSIGLYWNQFS